MIPQLSTDLFRPADSAATVDEIVSATVAYARSAREVHRLDLDRVLIFSVPFDPARAESWRAAERRLPEVLDGQNVRFEWSKWGVWTVPRGDLVGGVPAEWAVRPADGKALVPRWVADGFPQPLGPDELKQLAAEALAMADHLQEQAENPELNTIEGGL